jgi:quinol monooxygenase YgiN
MLTIIAEIQTHAGAEHRQAVLDAFKKSFQLYWQKMVVMVMPH